MASHLHDMAIELTNKAKEASETQQKLWFLAQVKEIVLFRDSSFLADILPDVLDMMVEKPLSLRRFLIQLAGEALSTKSLELAPVVLPMFKFLLGQGNDSLNRCVATELYKCYSRLVMYIASMPIKTKAQIAAGQADPKSAWIDLRDITNALEETIASEASDETRFHCIRLLEDMILFGLPLPPPSSDPRLARSQHAQRGTSATAADISLTHAFISRDDIEQEAESQFSKLLLWVNKGGPSNYPFSPYLLAQAASTVAAIATSRPKKAQNVIEALVFLTTNKKSLCSAMKAASRDTLLRAMQRLQRVATVHFANDTDVLIQRLKTALSALQSIADEGSSETAAAAEEDESSKARKRGVTEMEAVAGAGTGSEGLGLEAEEKLRQQAKEAVDQAENSLKLKSAKLESTGAISQTPGGTGTTAGGSGGVGGVSIGASAKTSDTELAGDLGDFPDISHTLTLARLPATITQDVFGSTETMVRLVPPPPDGYNDLALGALQRVLEAFREMKSFGLRAVQANSKVAIRMAVNMSMVDKEGGKPGSTIPIISSLSTAPGVSKLADEVPLEVTLPRPMWLLLSFVLMSMREDALSKGNHRDHAMNANIVVKGPQETGELLVGLLQEIFSRVEMLVPDEAEGEGFEAAPSFSEQDPCLILYDTVCICLLSRIMQNVYLRPAAKVIFTSIPRVPPSCLKLMSLLMHTGTVKGTAPTGRKSAASMDRGTRTEARELLGQIALGIDETAAASALNSLLWCCVSEDFETRDKSVKALLSKVVMESQWVWDTVSLFAVQAAISVIGAGVITERFTGSEEIINAAGKESGKTDYYEMGDGGDNAIPTPPLSLSYALECFDDGQSFDGVFPSLPTSPPLAATADGNEPDPAAVAAAATTRAMSHVRKAFHLLLQISTVDSLFLPILFDLYAACCEDVSAEGSSTTSSTSIVTECVRTVIRGEMATIIPALAKKMKPEEVFEKFSMSDVRAKPLVGVSLFMLHTDLHMPAVPKMISLVKAYILRTSIKVEEDEVMEVQATGESGVVDSSGLAAGEGEGAASKVEDGKEEVTAEGLEKDGSMEVVSDGGEATAEVAKVIKPSIDDSIYKMSDIDVAANVQLILPLLGGLSRSEVEILIPRLLHILLGDTPAPTSSSSSSASSSSSSTTAPATTTDALVPSGLDAVKGSFLRIVQARPPPMSKSALLALLHRIPIDTPIPTHRPSLSITLKVKQITDAIGICAAAKDEFTGDVFVDALSDLLSDTPPPLLIMRTAITSSQIFEKIYPEVRKFLFTKVVPSLLRRRVWAIAPRIFDGIAAVFTAKVNLLKEGREDIFRDAEPSLRCLLGLPGGQLKMILKSAPYVKTFLTKVLKALSAAEKEEVISGRWAGLDITQEEATKGDVEKKKIIKELS